MSSASKNELDDLSKRINELSPEKRQLLELLLGEENGSGWKQEEYVAPSNEIEQIITTVWQQVLGIKQIGINDNFFELGGDSIQSIQIIAKTRQYGIYFTTNQLFEHPTIFHLSKIAQKRSVRQETTSIATGEILLTPVQHWFFEQNLADFHHWNQSIMLEVREGEDFALVQEAFKQLFSYHDLLQARFEKIDGVWKQWVDDTKSKEIFSYYDLSNVDQKEDEVSKLIGSIQASFQLETGKLFKVVLFDLGKIENPLLLMTAHHLIVDGISFRILLEDFQTIYKQLKTQKEVILPPKTTPFRTWASKLAEYAQSPELEKEVDFWLQTSQKNSLPVDFDSAQNTEASAENVTISLSAEDTKHLLQQIPALYRTQINEVLLASLAQSIASWTGESQVQIDIEGHGREEIAENLDVSRTVGWFTSIFPILLKVDTRQSHIEVLQSIKEQLRLVPNRGIGFGLLSYLNTNLNDRLQSLPKSEIVFNYLGQFDQVMDQESILKLSKFSCEPLYSPSAKRNYLLQVVGNVLEGKLSFSFTYSRNIHRRDTIESLAKSFSDNLTKLINNSQHANAKLSPIDFPEAELSQADLDKILAAE